jgi:hypothetical protein
VNLRSFLVVLGVAVVMGIALVFQHASNVRLGYRIAALEARRDSLAKENARIAAEITRERNPEELREKLRAMGLELEPIGGRLDAVAYGPGHEAMGER